MAKIFVRAFDALKNWPFLPVHAGLPPPLWKNFCGRPCIHPCVSWVVLCYCLKLLSYYVMQLKSYLYVSFALLNYQLSQVVKFVSMYHFLYHLDIAILIILSKTFNLVFASKWMNRTLYTNFMNFKQSLG